MKKRRAQCVLIFLVFLLVGCTNNRSAIHSAPNTASQVSVNYDLTEMGSDMVYAIVYQLMQNPEQYIGKTLKIKGQYYPSYYEPTGQYYHYCIIEDATACCSQGLEFVWEDGNHSFPDDYPPESSPIIVTGTYETYQEKDDPNLYCRLTNATLEVEK